MMKLSLLFVGTLLLLGGAAQAQTGSVGIGTNSPNAKAALDISATNKGLLLPRLSKTQRLALSAGPIATPPGLTVFQTGPDSVGVWAYSGLRWLWLNGGSADNLGNHTATQNLSLGTNLLTGGGTNGIRIGTDGQTVVSTTNPGSGGANWIATNVGGAVGDRVVSGLLGGRATLGAHNSTLGVWAPLYLNPGGNVGVGGVAASQKLTVEGQVYSTTGGFRFPDNTVQTTAVVPGNPGNLDNLGNHTATQNLNLGTNALLGNYTGATVEGLTLSPSGRVNVTADVGGGWIGTNIGALTGDRVVSGLLGGRATLGAHNSTLGVWAPLYLNPGGNVGVGGVAASEKLTVEGQVFSTTGGFRFPDNTVQTTANPPQQLSISGSTISLTNGGAVTLPPSDNLGNHTATQNLNLGTKQLTGGGTTGLAVSSAGQVGIGTPVPDASAALEVASTTRGLLPPRLSQTQRDAIAAPAAGLHIFNTSTNRPNFWDGVRWQESVSMDAMPGSTLFAYTGGSQTYTVPVGVYRIRVTANGASGGQILQAGSAVSAAAPGSRVVGEMEVVPGHVLVVEVGGGGGHKDYIVGTLGQPGYNGGGPGSTEGAAGGGATALHNPAPPGFGLLARLLVAAGGGGATRSLEPLSPTQTISVFRIGGSGDVSGNGIFGGGSAGTTTSGGNGGSSNNGNPGGSGTLGLGGNGSHYGGGGGGGYYGGGGGGGNRYGPANTGGSGGGGSSWVGPLFSDSTILPGGAPVGHGSLLIEPLAVPVIALGTTPLTGTASGNAAVGLTMAAGGQVRLSTTNPGAGGANWIALNAGAIFNTPTFLSPSISTDRVVLGLLNGKATVGGHNNALNAWADLILNSEPSAGNVGIGTTAPSQKLHVVGNIVATGSIGGVSDRRYKERFAPLPNALQNVLQINGLTYYWRRAEFPEQHFGPERQLGSIAQDVEKLYPEMVATDAAGYKSVDYGRLTPVLVEAIKELKTQLDQSRAEAAGAKAEATGAKAEATAATTATADLRRRVQALEVPGARAAR